MTMQRRSFLGLVPVAATGLLGGLGSLTAGSLWSPASAASRASRTRVAVGSITAADTKPVVVLSAADFGIRGDTGTDQGPALLRLRDYMTADRSKHYQVVFAPGTYHYVNNRWLLNVGSVSIEANGSTFACISDSVAEQNSRPLNLNSMFQDHGDQHWPDGLKYQAGYLIRAAKPGDQVIRMATTADAGRFAVGSRVLVHSFDQQWAGFPPNLRFVEWRKVIGVDRTTGTVTLDAPLENEHLAVLRDTMLDPALNFAVGKARLLPLDRAAFRYPELVQITGATFARNPNQPADFANGLCVPADTLVLHDCTVEGWTWPSENRRAVYTNCRFANVEVDKLCDTVEFHGCVFNGRVIGATGANDLLVETSQVKGYIGVSARQIRIINDRIEVPSDDPWGAIRPYYDSWPVERLECVGNEIVHDGPLHFAINGGQRRELAASGRGANNSILLNDTAYYRDEVIRQLQAGSRLRLKGSSVMGTITRIDWTGTQWRLQGNWTTTIIAGQVWEFCNVQNIAESGTTFVGGDTLVLRPLESTQQRVAPSEDPSNA